MVVGDRGLPRIDRLPAGDLVERVNRKGRGAVRGRQQVGVDAERGARPEVARGKCAIDPMGPHDLLGGGHRHGPSPRPAQSSDGRRERRTRGTRGGPRRRCRRCRESLPLSATAGPARSFAPGDVLDRTRERIERELVAVLRVGHRLRALDDVETEVEGVATEDVAHVGAADDHQLEPDFFGHGLEAGWTHLPRRANGEPVAGDDERLAGVHAAAEIRHEIAERADLPPLVERVEALGHAVGRRRDLVGVDRVELARARRRLRIPENERAAANQRGADRWHRRRRRGEGIWSIVTPGLSRAGTMTGMSPDYPSFPVRRRSASAAAASKPRQARTGMRG